MNIQQITNIFYTWGLVFVIVAILINVLKSSWLKGKIGEHWTKRTGEKNLDEKIYTQIHNVTLRTDDGTTQIDHIILSKFGIFVIETKNMSGWIFGDKFSSFWTQVKNGRKNKFQNPLHQNYKHIKELQKIVEIDESNFFSVVIFTGNAKLKTKLPENITDKYSYIEYIKSKNDQIIDDENIEKFIETIEKKRLPRSLKTDIEHIRYLKRKFKNRTRTNFYAFECALKIFILAILVIAATYTIKHTSELKKNRTNIVATKKTDTPNKTSENNSSNKENSSQKENILQNNNINVNLKIYAYIDTSLTLYNPKTSEKILTVELKKGNEKEFEIPKGEYTAEIAQSGNRTFQSVNFISSAESLEF